MDDNKIRSLLMKLRHVTILGISDKPHRASYGIAAYLVEKGYRVDGVNPSLKEVLGAPVYPSLAEVPEPLEIVNVFRASEHVAGIVEALLPIKPQFLWLQEGVVDPVAEQKAMEAGIEVISDRCILKEHARLVGK